MVQLLTHNECNASPPPYGKNMCAGMRGDFLGQATVEWDELEPGRDLNLKLMKPGRLTQGVPVKGTIKLRVGEPTKEAVETEQGRAGSSLTMAPVEQKKVKYTTVAAPVYIYGLGC